MQTYMGADGRQYGQMPDGSMYVLTGQGWQPMAASGYIPPGGGAMISQTNLQDLRAQAAQTPAPDPDSGIYQRPFWPTAPRYYRGSGKITRDYSTGVLPTDQDYVVGSEMARTIRFDIPCTVTCYLGGAFPTQLGNAFPVGIGPLDCWMFRAEYSSGEKWQISSRLANNIVGTGQRPGEVGGDGNDIDMGGSLQVYITPLLPNLKIDLTVKCLEQRGKRNFTIAGK